MNKSKIDITIEVDDRGSVKLRKFGEIAETAGKKSSKSLDETGKSLQEVDTRAGSALKPLTSIAGLSFAAVAGGIAVVSGAMVAMVGAAASQAREMNNLSALAQMNSTDFQAMAYATDKVGISAEKLADISKDTREKLGEFVATGGGGFKDFFDNVAPQVNLTSAELMHLSGPEVLVAVKKAMDEANISAEEQSFYLESIASDTTMLIPLLENSGRALKEEAARARELGIAISEVDSAKLLETRRATDELKGAFVGVRNEIAAELAPVITEITEDFLSWWRVNGDLVKQDIPTFIRGVGSAFQFTAEFIGVVVNSTREWVNLFERGEAKAAILELREQLGEANNELYRAQEGWFGFGKASTEEIAKAQARVDELMAKIRQLEGASTGSFNAMITSHTSYTDSLEAIDAELVAVFGSLDKMSFAQRQGTVAAHGHTEAIARQQISLDKLDSALVDVFGSLDDTSRAQKEAAEAAVEAGKEMTDSWELHHRDRYEIQSRSLQAAIDLEEQQTGLMTDIWDATVTGMDSSFKNVLGAGLRGEFDSIGDAFGAFMDNILNTFIGTLAQMVSEWAISGIAGLFSGAGFGGFSVGGLLGGGASAAAGAGSGAGIFSGLASIGSAAYQGVTGGFSGLGAALGFGSTAAGPGYMIGTGAGSFATYGATGAAGAAGGAASTGAAAGPAGSGAAGSASLGAIGSLGLAAGGIGLIAGVMTGFSFFGDDVKTLTEALNDGGVAVENFVSQGFSSEIKDITDEQKTAFKGLGYEMESTGLSIDRATNSLVVVNETQDSFFGNMAANIYTMDEVTGKWVSGNNALFIDGMEELRKTFDGSTEATYEQIAVEAEAIASGYGMAGMADELAASFMVNTGAAATYEEAMAKLAFTSIGAANAAYGAAAAAGQYAQFASNAWDNFYNPEYNPGPTNTHDGWTPTPVPGDRVTGYGGGHDDAGKSKGGVVDYLVTPRGDQGWGALRLGEGVVSQKGMENLARINRGSFGSGDGVEEKLDALISANIKMISYLKNISKKSSKWDATGLNVVAA
jgi:hypothetical protein